MPDNDLCGLDYKKHTPLTNKALYHRALTLEIPKISKHTHTKNQFT